jgi:hypothetical protein
MQHPSLNKLKSLSKFIRKSEGFAFMNFNVPMLVKFIESDLTLSSYMNTLILDKKEHYEAGISLATQGKIIVSSSLPPIELALYRVENLEDFEGYVAFCYGYLTKTGKNKGWALINNFLIEKKNPGMDRREDFFNDCISPIVTFLELQIETSFNVMAVLQRYKMLCEWYERENIKSNDELSLTKNHLSKFLFDQGFTYVLSETNVPSGRIDNFALNLGYSSTRELSSLPNIVVAEGKIYKNNKRDIQVVKNQVYDRCVELNLSEGFCVIYNKSPNTLQIGNSFVSSGIQYLTQSSIRIYFLIINLDESFYQSQKANQELIVEIQ